MQLGKQMRPYSAFEKNNIWCNFLFFSSVKNNTNVHYWLWSYLGVLTKSFFSFKKKNQMSFDAVTITSKRKNKNNSEFRDWPYLLESNSHSAPLLMIKSSLHCNTRNMDVALLSLRVWVTLYKKRRGAPILFPGFSTSPVILMQLCFSILSVLVYPNLIQKGLEITTP